MKALFYSLALQVRLDIRNKYILITYYVVPLLFFLFIGGIFSSINQTSRENLVQSMVVFSVTMGAILGTPIALTELYGGEIKKSYKAGHIPMWIVVVNNFISAFINLFIVSIIILLTAPLIFSAVVPKDMLVYFVSLICFLLASISIGTILGLVVKSASKLMLIGQIVFLPSLMLSGIMFPTSMLPDFLAKVGYVFPATIGFKSMSSGIFQIVELIVMAAIFVIFGAVSLVLVKRNN